MNLSPKILFEDQDIIVIDKPAGMIVNRADTSRHTYTVQEWVESKYKLKQPELKGNESISEFESRGGIVHRLDKETSGVLVIAKNEESFMNLQSQFKSRVVKKKYVALVHGEVDQEGSINGKIARIGDFGKFGIDEGGRESETLYKKVSGYKLTQETIERIVSESNLKTTHSKRNYLKQHASTYSLVSVFPKTGRTHQIRVHMKSVGAPLVSDLIYGPKKLLKFDLLWCPRLFLHAESIVFKHPKKDMEVNFESLLPQDLSQSLNYLSLESI